MEKSVILKKVSISSKLNRAKQKVTLADRLLQNSGDEYSNNIERAIKYYKQSLHVYTRQTDPHEWASIMGSLAQAYMTRFRGRQADNLERAIFCAQQALEIFTSGVSPEWRAWVSSMLALAYTERMRGERTDNLERAIEHFEQALEGYTLGALPQNWAATQINLAAAYAERIRGERADNLEYAIDCFQKALEVYTPEAFLHRWAAIQSNLAAALVDRIRGDRAENLEQAIECAEQALQVVTREASPQNWAAAKNHLAEAYRNRIAGERAENLERAIHCYEQALEVYSRNAFPRQWAIIQHNLALAYSGRIRDGRVENLERTIHCLRQALTVHNRKTFPEQWAWGQADLAAAYRERGRGDRAENLERAIRHAGKALQIYTREAFPDRWAMTQVNLGLAYQDRARGGRAENVKRAFEHLQAATQVYTREAYPSEHRIVKRNLGELQFEILTWERAHAAFAAAMDAGADLLAAAYTEIGRRAEVSETARLYAHDAYTLLRLERPGDGLVRLEQGKTRLLSEALALGALDLTGLPQADQEAIRSARRAVHELEAEMRLPANTPARRSDRVLADGLRQARADLNRHIARIRAERPEFMPTGLKLPELLGLIPDGGALVAPLFTSKGSAVFVLPHGAKTVTGGQIIELDRFTDADLHAVLRGPADEPGLGGWLGAYANHRISPQIPIFKREWWEAIEAVGGALWDSLLGPVHERLQRHGLQQGAPVLITPQGGLGLLPLHAAWRIVEGKKRYFLDDWTITYVPSGYALSVSRERLTDAARQEHGLVAVINPTRDLPFTPAEGQAVTALFPDARSLPAGAATLGAVTDAVRGRQYLHFSCHGFYHWQDPMQSGLVLAEGTLTLSEIIAKLDLGASRLITLSACETGITDITQSPDEYLGLPAGFLQAGAPAVVSTLWPVNDLSTMLLMERFYQNLLGARGAGTAAPMPLAAALREAQIWLRDVSAGELAKRSDAIGEICAELPPEHTRFDQPYHWAAFTFSGA